MQIRQEFIKKIGIGIAGYFLLGNLDGSWHKQKCPNILLIMVDDMGFSDSNCFGCEAPSHIFDFAFAGFFLPIIQNLGNEMDKADYIEALKRAAEAAGRRSGQFLAKRSPEISLFLSSLSSTCQQSLLSIPARLEWLPLQLPFQIENRHGFGDANHAEV